MKEEKKLNNVSALAAEKDLSMQGLFNVGKVHWNLSYPTLYEEAIKRNEGSIVEGGPLLVHTGKHTARAANDKFIVKENSSEDKIWWGKFNKPFDEEKFNSIHNKMKAYCQGKDLFVQDCYAGADEKYRLPIRVITDDAWRSFFAKNMFISPKTEEEYNNFNPEFTVLALAGFKTNPEVDGTNSDTTILLNFAANTALIAHSAYGGEIKKSVFTLLNYLLTFKEVLPMHCSANVGDRGDVALFFGLSGTGKTSLSADPKRKLIGDDEHGWSPRGIFNFENGCYAKVIRLSPEAEPFIYACTSRFGTILENVIFDPITREINLDDDTITENTRASYPLEFIPNVVDAKKVDEHPKNIIFLTCDASGVMPPIALLNPEQAQYHFISGYTSKIAGTEIGLGIEPQMTFSACFGGSFMVRHPFDYAEMLKERINKHKSKVWLVNTGWVGGKFGIGKRISIKHTRALLNAALEGKLDNVEYREDKLFGYKVPLNCPEIPQEILEPSNSWSDKDEFWKKYDELAAKFIENFKQFESGCSKDVLNAGPKRLR